jgi:hypothetical protein
MDSNANKLKEEFDKYGVTKYFEDTIINNIVVFAVMLIIYLFILADKTQGYSYVDIFVFMEMITNPTCDKVYAPKKKEPENKKAKANAPAAPAAPAGLPAMPAGLPAMPGGLSGLSLKGGGTVSDQLIDAAKSVKNIGNAFNAFTSDVKKDIDYEIYLKETITKFKETYCEDMDTMGCFGVFFFALHSSYLASYNAIQFVNTAIMRLLYLKPLYGYIDVGVGLLYLIFILTIMSSSSFITYVIKLFPDMPSSNSYLTKIFLTIFSALVSLFLIYFLVAVIAYFTYLTYGIVNIKSEQSSMTFKFVYFVLIALIVIYGIPSLFGINLI